MKSSKKKALKSARKRVIKAAIGWAEESKREMVDGSLMAWGRVVRREQSLERAVTQLLRCMEVAQ